MCGPMKKQDFFLKLPKTTTFFSALFALSVFTLEPAMLFASEEGKNPKNASQMKEGEVKPTETNSENPTEETKDLATEIRALRKEIKELSRYIKDNPEKSLPDLIDELESLEDEVEKLTNRYSRAKKIGLDRITIRFNSIKKKEFEKEIEKQYHSENRSTRLHLGLTYRGVISDHRRNSEKIGFEAGIGLPLWHGIDLGVAAGSLFAKSHDAIQKLDVRIYLRKFRRKLYVAAALVSPSSKKLSHASIGWGFRRFYAELNFRQGDNTALSVVPQFGYRYRL